MAKKAPGTLIIIGGREDKHDGRAILQEVARNADGGKLVIATIATSLPGEIGPEYTRVFKELGVKQTAVLDVRDRQDAFQEENVALLDDATVVFFTGGDQLRIVSQVGDSPLYQRIHDIYKDGGTIAGTSAGASVMSETMMLSGAQDQSQKLGNLNMAPGFGLLKEVIIDQHFAERGRISRLVAAVAQNPRNLGVGIDENTAIVVRDGYFDVMGDGGVYVVDGSGISVSNISDGDYDEVLSCFDVKLHALNDGNCFDLVQRRPAVRAQEPVASIEPTRAERRNGSKVGRG